MKNLIGISGKKGSGKDEVGLILQYFSLDANKKSILGEFTHYSLWKKEFVEYRAKHSSYEIKKYADKLKDIVCILIGCTRDELEDRDFKEKELGEKWNRIVWHIQSNHNKCETFSSREGAEEGLSHWEENYGQEVYIAYEEIIMTPRLLLQTLGTECGRQIIHPDIWINSLFVDYVPVTESYNIAMLDFSGETKSLVNKESLGHNGSSWIITDVRFEDERKAITDREGVVIRVNRPCECTKHKHPMDDTVVSCDCGLPEHISETALDDCQKFDYIIENDGTLEDLFNKVKAIWKSL